MIEPALAKRHIHLGGVPYQPVAGLYRLSAAQIKGGGIYFFRRSAYVGLSCKADGLKIGVIIGDYAPFAAPAYAEIVAAPAHVAAAARYHGVRLKLTDELDPALHVVVAHGVTAACAVQHTQNISP